MPIKLEENGNPWALTEEGSKWLFHGIPLEENVSDDQAVKYIQVSQEEGENNLENPLYRSFNGVYFKLVSSDSDTSSE